jgi:iron complex outermembrane receptor protein
VRVAWLVAATGCAAVQAQAQAPDNPAAATEGAAVEVVATRPLPGLGTALRDIPSSVQSATAEELLRRDARDLVEGLATDFAGVALDDAPGNRFQQNLIYRGFVASPLLGAPQGLSVFVDGVRVNEPFGDTVNWDLIPRNAIATAHLLSGSNPAFGLNTLGGALSVQTKSGFAFPGSSARFAGGSFGRRSVEAETGGHGGRVDYFAAVDAQDEAGWREHSPSRLRRGFFKTGWQDALTDLDVSLAVADNSLHGTQALPSSMLSQPRQAYTWPDSTQNQLAFLALRGNHFVERDVLVTGSLYLRGLNQQAAASNVNDDFNPAAPSAPGNRPAFNDRTALDQLGAGAGLQLVVRRAGQEFSLGASVDGASIDYAQDRQEGSFSVDREAVGAGPFVPRTRLGAHNLYRALYFIDQISPAPRWTLTVAARYDVAQVRMRDRSGAQPALDAEHDFRRLNPSLGMNWNPSDAASAFASVAQAMRTPSPVELGCADPAAPCLLPNQFLADPSLRPVVARTVEAGVRLRPAPSLRLSASAYRSVLADDIQFVSSSTTGAAGFFRNAGDTLRQGFELKAVATREKLTASASYAYVRAEYLTGFRMPSPNNSTRDAAGEIAVERGNEIPGIARSMFKLALDWAQTPAWWSGFAWTWFDRQYARGDENNRDLNGPLPAYAVAQLYSAYRLARSWDVSLKVDNLFDRQYRTAGVLGRNFFPAGAFNAAAATPEQFAVPGAPRALWLAARYETR